MIEIYIRLVTLEKEMIYAWTAIHVGINYKREHNSQPGSEECPGWHNNQLFYSMYEF